MQPQSPFASHRRPVAAAAASWWHSKPHGTMTQLTCPCIAGRRRRHCHGPVSTARAGLHRRRVCHPRPLAWIAATSAVHRRLRPPLPRVRTREHLVAAAPFPVETKRRVSTCMMMVTAKFSATKPPLIQRQERSAMPSTHYCAPLCPPMLPARRPPFRLTAASPCPWLPPL